MSHPYLHILLCRARTADFYRDAVAAPRVAEARLAANTHRPASARDNRRSGPHAERANPEPALTLRHYSAEDHGSLARLAALDSSKPPPQPLVVAEFGGELRVALSLRDGSLVANPFHLTQGVAELLRAYARQFDLQTAARVSACSSSSSPAICVEGALA